MLEILKQKRPWQVWGMLIDTAVSVLIGTCLMVPAMMAAPDGRTTLLPAVVLVSTGICLGELWLLAKARRWGRYLYIWSAVIAVSLPLTLLDLLVVFRLYCAFCRGTKAYFQAGEATAAVMRSSRSRGLPGRIWLLLAAVLVSAPWVRRFLNSILSEGLGLLAELLVMDGSVEYLYGRMIASGAVGWLYLYLVWFLLLQMALAPAVPIGRFFTAKSCCGILAGAVLTQWVPELVGFFTPQSNINSMVPILWMRTFSALLPLLSMLLLWRWCIAPQPFAAGWLRGYFRGKSGLFFAAALVVGLLPVVLMTEHTFQGIAATLFPVTYWAAPPLVEDYASPVAQLLLWFSFWTYGESSRIQPADAD